MQNKDRKSCYLCGSTEFEEVRGIVRDNPDIKVKRCKKCSLISLDSTNHIDEKFYADGKMRSNNFVPELWAEKAYPDDFRRFKFLKNKIKNKTVVDFGCGAGGFINIAKDSCKSIYGVELEERLKNYHNEKGLKVFSDIGEIEEKADFVTMFHVFEHIEDPLNLLEKLKNSLKDNKSEIIIEVPNSDDALISLYKSEGFLNFTWWSCHLYTYNKKSLKLLMKKAGYKINYIKGVQRYGIFNHLYWIFKGQPGGHLKFEHIKLPLFEKIYAGFLKLLGKTDTIIISISPR
ncbi:class I SAM-dependent methyltransferase [bacterium]|nr:class I SAM-dependent methyltransferase [bacterium]